MAYCLTSLHSLNSRVCREFSLFLFRGVPHLLRRHLMPERSYHKNQDGYQTLNLKNQVTLRFKSQLHKLHLMDQDFNFPPLRLYFPL